MKFLEGTGPRGARKLKARGSRQGKRGPVEVIGKGTSVTIGEQERIAAEAGSGKPGKSRPTIETPSKGKAAAAGA